MVHSAEIKRVMTDLGLGELQAYRHIVQRRALQARIIEDRRKNSRAFFNRFA